MGVFSERFAVTVGVHHGSILSSPASSETLHRLTSADNGLVRLFCGVRLEQRIRTKELHEKLRHH